MKRMALVCLLSALALPITSPAVDISRATELQDKEEIESALKLAKSIDEISRNVRSCSDQGVSHEKCLCQNKRLIDRQSTLIEETLQKHPNWKAIGWFKFKDENGEYRVFNARGLQRQADVGLNCS